jgi:hypothetical protein
MRSCEHSPHEFHQAAFCNNPPTARGQIPSLFPPPHRPPQKHGNPTGIPMDSKKMNFPDFALTLIA